MQVQAPYGSWPSPISARLLADASSSVSRPSTDRGNIYWVESRPAEKGRNTIMEKSPAGQVREVLPAPRSVRSTVHEYGGGDYLAADGVLFYCQENDQRIYRLALNDPRAEPTAITPAVAEGSPMLRFADLCFDAGRQCLYCVCEDHSAAPEPENYIAIIDVAAIDTSATADPPRPPVKLVSGADFYAYPRLSPDGARLCWISWMHPNMPWDCTELWLAQLGQDGAITNQQRVAGGDNTSIFQPHWSPDNSLYYISDQTGWWNIYRHETSGAAYPVCPKKAEFATPLWNLGMATYGFLDTTTLFCCYTENSAWRLATINLESGDFNPIASDYTWTSGIHCGRGQALFAAANPVTSPVLCRYDPEQDSLDLPVDTPPPPVAADFLSQPASHFFPTAFSSAAPRPESRAHLLYYPPANRDFCGTEDEQPPLVVLCHGGPTGMASPQLNLKIQFWTSRGFAVADINYRGSTGFGRRYRDSLRGQWGVADVEDAVNGARYLVEQGLADGDKTLIRGGSAGGYTVLAALAFQDYFRAGACLYGIGDLETLAGDTHKFESRYLDRLIGKYPEEKSLYRQRSPVNHISSVSCPVIFFQGMDDKVVPPQQTRAMVEALREKRLPVASLFFPGEAHGFRKAETLEQSLQAELYFYARVLGFPPPADCQPITIENLPADAPAGN